MDDILVLAPTRWKLRQAVRAVNEVLGSLRLEKHAGKTFIGRIEKGFDFFGFNFSGDGLRVAKASIGKFVERAARLYEQDGKDPTGSPPVGSVCPALGWARRRMLFDVSPNSSRSRTLLCLNGGQILDQRQNSRSDVDLFLLVRQRIKIYTLFGPLHVALAPNRHCA